MNESVIILLCFLPLIAIFITIKIYLLFTETKKEINYVKTEAKKPHGPYLEWEEDEDEDAED